jgi:tripartite-type tricarboxylate transporter receptor subunit TctC
MSARRVSASRAAACRNSRPGADRASIAPRRCAPLLIASLAFALLHGPALAAGKSGPNADRNAGAAAFPAKPIRMISPYAPGGGSDTLARTIGAKLSEAWGQPVIVENRPGAAASIGAEAAAKATPDGYTLLVTPSAALTINPHIYPKLRYDPVKDFEPVTIATNSPYLLVVHPSIPVASVKELLAYARAKPGQLSYSSSGNGSSTHLAGVLFSQLAGVQLLHVPYKGSAPAIVDLLAGQVQLRFSSVVPVLPHVKTGKLRALGLSSAKRYSPLPDIPTIAESGLPGFVVESWYAVLAPAHTPRPIVSKLNAEIVHILKSGDMKARLAAEGAEVIASTPEELAKWIRNDLARWAKPVRDSGARAQ